ncbi:MAG: KpsF/GutQ family sugar-phosphate isomerase [Alphaproteobacteria bacterium]|nr:KpsF/GutQ family sugar-phosphate isomerase [Alphaproteobacteria bacterium]
MTNKTVSTAQADLDSARRVLSLEAQALQSMAEGLDGAFLKALDILAAVAGRVVVSGMGKSGHVGHKIAATLASTGTPAVFVHPAEASHGDLGMITAKDAVLALSNSGETAELSDLIAYTRRFAIPLVGITSRESSSLGEAADVALVLPTMSEACPMGLAPTTSTTMMLAMGDALAVTLLERRGFTAADFQMLHPGGALGRKLLKVSDLMHQDGEVPLVAPDQPVAEALLVMTNKRFGCAGVVGPDGLLAGIVTDGDLRRHMSDGMLKKTAREIMTRDPKTVRPQILAAEALRIMNASSITTLFVVEAGKPVGILHVHDCLRAGVA